VTWTDAKTAAAAAGVTLDTMWKMVRRGAVKARRLGGRRARVRVAMDGEGFPVFR
jgi:hypothetical protein